MLQRADLWSLEQYSEARAGFREEVLAHKQNRRVRIGDHVLLIFEDQLAAIERDNALALMPGLATWLPSVL